MKYLQKTGLWLATLVLVFSLFAFAISFTLSKTIRNKETVKTWLAQSGFYDELGSGLIEQASNGTDTLEGSSLDNPEVQAIIRQSFNPALFQKIAESVLDASFLWLEGNTELIKVDVDLSQAKQQLAEGLSLYAINRMNSLPTCTALQMGAMTATNDPLTMQCKPIGYNTAQVQQEVRASVAESLNFIPDSYTNQSLQSGQASGQILPEQAKKVYSLSGWLPVLFLVLLVLSGVGIVLLSVNRRKGMYKLGSGLLLVAISMGVLAIFLTKAPDILIKSLTTTSAGQGMSKVITELLSIACSDMAKFIWWFAGIYLLFGLGIVLIARFVIQDRQLPPTSPDTNLGSSQPPLL